MNSQVKRDPYKFIGTNLERYEIQELVGIGGMGVVYRAQHEITKARVAIKILRPDLTISNEEGVGFFFEEATKTVSLRHPMIIKVISADYTPDGSAYMVMEWLDGRTLADEMKEHGPPPLPRVIGLLEQIADAVAYAHRKGIIHRDLKPSNIMLVREESGEESIRVLDFGIAKVLSTTIGTNTRVAGTSYYISPEQTIAHSPIDQGADIYSLGIILYQLLTGQVPFEGDSEGQVMDMHRSILPRPLRDIRPDIPQAIEDVVLKAIAKRPLDRFPTAIDFARAFRQAANIAMSELVLQCVDATSGAAVSQADIYLNGKHEGRTGEDGWWSKRNMTPRQYLIEAESPRYVSLNRSVELQPNEELTVVAKLERKQIGELIVSCNVPNAVVEVAGKPAGDTDQNGRLYIESIAAGTYLIRVTHPKYLPAESTVKVEVWKQAYAPLQLDIRPQRNLLESAMRTVGALARALSKRWNERAGLQAKAAGREVNTGVVAENIELGELHSTEPEPILAPEPTSPNPESIPNRNEEREEPLFTPTTGIQSSKMGVVVIAALAGVVFISLFAALWMMGGSNAFPSKGESVATSDQGDSALDSGGRDGGSLGPDPGGKVSGGKGGSLDRGTGGEVNSNMGGGPGRDPGGKVSGGKGLDPDSGGKLESNKGGSLDPGPGGKVDSNKIGSLDPGPVGKVSDSKGGNPDPNPGGKVSSNNGGSPDSGPGGKGGGKDMGLGGDGRILPMSASLRPTKIYMEKAKYTEEARRNKVRGTVVLNVVFTADGRISDIRVVSGLPYGLTEKAIEAAQNIRFQPAVQNGTPVSVRGNLEFKFDTY
jgi:TonB family protein